MIMAADHTKIGMRAVVKLCELDELDVIVTDREVCAEARAWLDSLGRKAIYAE